ncbi:MAG: hypothetical protein AAFR75_00915 [Pseudomonadota bacterium]
MRQNRFIPDMRTRLAMLEHALNIRGNKAWLNIVDYEDSASISRIKSGEQNMNEPSVRAICNAANIKFDDFFAPPRELGKKLGLSAHVVDMIIDRHVSDQNKELEILPEDIRLAAKISGRYMMVYLGRDTYDPEKLYGTVEVLSISAPANGDAECSVRQEDNYVTGEATTGTLKVRGGVLSITLEYDEGSYPDSHFVLKPLVLSANTNIFGGLYLDINAAYTRDIFSAQIVCFSVEDDFVAPRQLEGDDPVFQAWLPVIENKIGVHHRLIARQGVEYIDQVKKAVLETKKWAK